MPSAARSDHLHGKITRRGETFAVTSLTAHHHQCFSGDPRAEENSTQLIQKVYPKIPHCQQLCDTFASALRSHPRGTLRRPEPRILGHRARNPSRGLPAAHASLKSVPLDAVKTIRGATSPHVNPGCVIILHRHGRTAPAKLGSHVLAYLLCHRHSPPLHRKRTKVSRRSGHRLSTQLARTHRTPRGFSPWHSGN